ncbi:MAG TPA: WbqC family protein [Candidatus Nanoarchaeia archaeon]
MRYSAIQPQYFPRLHYFARILNADIFMIRDDVQFVRKHKYPNGKTDKSYQADTPIKQSFGTYLLSVPTRHEGKNSLAKTKISYDQPWLEKHQKTLQFVHGKSLNFHRLHQEINELLSARYENLADLNNATIFWGILRLLEEPKITTGKLSIDFLNSKLKNQRLFRLKEIKKASDSKALKASKNLGPNEKIIALCKEIGANEDYCGGTAHTAYMDPALFRKNGIKLTVQDWKCRQYPQLFTKQVGFIPNLSIIDLLMNVPKDEAVKIIKG